MKLGLVTGYTGTGVPMDLIHAAEDAGFDSVWTAEAYGSDAIVPLAWIFAHLLFLNCAELLTFSTVSHPITVDKRCLLKKSLS